MQELTTPDILYKYLPPNRLDVLVNGLIRYTQFGAFNDPFDGRPYFSALAPHDYLVKSMVKILPEEIRRAYEALIPEQQAQIPYELFYAMAMSRASEVAPDILKNMTTITPLIQNFLHMKLDKLIGALSLSEVADDVLMWAHYAQGHTGFVLGFDAQHPYFNARLSENDEFRHLRRVEYRNERPAAPMSDLSGIEAFLVKSQDWAYEREWRIMRPLEDAESVIDEEPFPICLFHYPSDAIKEIIIGEKILSSVKKVLRDVLAARPHLQHIVLRKAVTAQQAYGVRLTEIGVSDLTSSRA